MSDRATPASSNAQSARQLRVLVVEDTPDVADLLRRALESEGFAVDVVTTLADGRKGIDRDAPDVVLLDLELPDGSGLDLLRERTGTGVPVVILSARGSEVDRVVGLELGAEDYVTKPFYPRELVTRVRRAASRGAAAPPGVLSHGDLVIDLASREAQLGDHPLDLTDREFDLLAHLAASPRQVFHRDDLLRAVWDSSPEWQSTKTVTEHVRRLRRKIERDPGRPRWIVTVGRAGYRFEPD